MSTTEEARDLLVDADSLESLWHATTAVNIELAIAGIVADSLEAGQVSDAHDVTTSEEVTRAQHATDHAIANLDSVTDRSIADLLVSLGRDLQLDVVAEGIVTSDQLAWAKAAGCTHAQGFFLARPEPEEDMRDSIVQLGAAVSPV